MEAKAGIAVLAADVGRHRSVGSDLMSLIIFCCTTPQCSKHGCKRTSSADFDDGKVGRDVVLIQSNLWFYHIDQRAARMRIAARWFPAIVLWRVSS